MHYHLEIIMPPTPDVESAIAQIMKPFSENNEAADKSAQFFDFYLIGGRYTGAHASAFITDEESKAFEAWLKDQGVTVSGMRMGKPTLSPASQAFKVDAKWREMFPGAGDQCLFFDHAKATDVHTVGELSPKLEACRVIIAAPTYDGSELSATTMLADQMWNGVIWQDTNFSGLVSDALAFHDRRIASYTEAYRDRAKVKPNWLAVTVDYHS